MEFHRVQYKGYEIRIPLGKTYGQDASFEIRQEGRAAPLYAGVIAGGFTKPHEAEAAAIEKAKRWIDAQARPDP